jgi:predicted Zn-dependent protease
MRRLRRPAPALALAGLLLAGGPGACAVSRRDEVRMGQEYARQLNAELPLVRDPEVVRYLTVLGDSIARVSDTRGFAWHFYLVDTREVNAFALPGGFVYVTRGLVERADSMSDLAGVLGHEVAHVTERHAARQLERANKANVGVMLACVLTGVCESGVARVGIEVGGAAVFARYSREDEREADREAVAAVVRAGIDPRGMVRVLGKLLAERERRPEGVEAWFATHPLEEERIGDTSKLIAALDPAVLASLTGDTPAYRAFRARLAALPPPPERRVADERGR